MLINLIFFFYTMCANPGIDEVTIEHYYKTRYGEKLDEEVDDDIENMEDTPEDDYDDEDEINEEVSALSDNIVHNRSI